MQKRGQLHAYHDRAHEALSPSVNDGNYENYGRIGNRPSGGLADHRKVGKSKESRAKNELRQVRNMISPSKDDDAELDSPER